MFKSIDFPIKVNSIFLGEKCLRNTHGCALKSMRMWFLAGVTEGIVKSMRMRFLVGVTEGTHGCAPKSMRMRFLVGVTEGAHGCAPKSMRMRFLVGVTEGAHGAENAAESTPSHPEPKK